MALELAQYRINVNAVAPGMIDTNIIKEPGILKLVACEREHSSAPWGRMGVAEDVVGAVLFLASDDAEYITGATILVDGGLSAGTLLPPHE
jgi:NAD(P)-dependent dehydrogenase (short-subunit alcohol dehydrogenase family)